MKSLFIRLNSYITGQFTQGHERSLKAKKNILSSLLIKGISIGISFITLPLTLNYVNPSNYGIWLTLSSIVGWLAFFDIGLTQGLRNKFAEARAKADDSTAQVYVSTTYAILGIIFTIIWSIFMIVNNFINWTKILNIPESMGDDVSSLAVIVFTYFCLTFVLRIITTILTSDQQPAKSSLIDLIGQIVSLIIIFILVKTTQGSLIKLGLALCLSPLLALFFANLFLFKGRYKRFRPEFSKINFHYAKDLFNLGLIFFIIQLANILQFQTANIIIANRFSTADVTSFNIVYKYFGLLVMLTTIFLTPFWSASTEAFLKNDIDWIKNAIKKYNHLNIIIVIIGAIMLMSSETIYRLWLGEGKVNISFALSFWGFLFFNTSVYGGKYVSFLNGISALRIQFVACIFSPFLFIASTLILIKYFNMGVYALFISSIIANFNTYLLAPLQYHMIIAKNKRSIWIK